MLTTTGIKANILIVDDEPNNLYALEAILEGLNQNIVKAGSGEEALRCLLNTDFAVILLDVSMPGIDGFETAELIRQRKRSYQTPIIFLTGLNPEMIHMFRGYEVGAVDYMIKPIVPEVLQSKVSVFVELYLKTAEINRQKEQLLITAALSEQRFYDLVQGLDAIVWEADMLEYCFTFVSKRAEAILGYSVEEWLRDGNFRAKLVHSEDQELVTVFYRDVMTRGEGGEIEYRARTATGQVVWLRDHVHAVKDGAGAVNHMRGVMVDITAHKEIEQRLAYLAHYDALTGLPNRILLQDRAEQLLAYNNRMDDTIAAVLFIDLDRFKFINDTLGHHVGDHVLKTVAQRLKACVRESDTVARLGGDEFIAMLSSVTHAEEAGLVARKILDALSEPFYLNGDEFFVTCSLGASLFPHDGDDFPTLLKYADIAMYRAKDKGRNGYLFYTKEMSTRTLQQLSLESGLRYALERGEFSVYYHPKIDLQSGEIYGVEALLRWDHPELGVIPPKEFIPLLEETGLIIPVGEWVLRTACEHNKAWQMQGVMPVRVAVNLSAGQFHQDGLAKSIMAVLQQTDLEPQWLELEVTESMMMQNAERTIDLLRQIKSIGVHLAIDDFGTGHSSLSSLKHFPISSVKIDQTFVKDIPHDEDNSAIALAIIAMAHSLRLKVIAEGVETIEQVNFLRQHGCDEIQGNVYSGPLPSDEIIELLRQRAVLRFNMPPQSTYINRQLV